jgi:ACT domain-containing protein
MKIEQISIFLENRIGRLGEVTNILAKANIDIKALSLADTSEFGILRLIVDKTDQAQSVLKENGVTVGRTQVVGVEVSHSPGGLNAILHLLQSKGLNVEYMYGFPYRPKEAIMIFRFDRTELALEVLQQNGVRIFSGEELCSDG